MALAPYHVFCQNSEKTGNFFVNKFAKQTLQTGLVGSNMQLEQYTSIKKCLDTSILTEKINAKVDMTKTQNFELHALLFMRAE